MCECINNITDELRKRLRSQKVKFGYVILPHTFSAPHRVCIEAIYNTYSASGKPVKKEKKLPLLANYCPFCGEKYVTGNDLVTTS